MGRRSLLDAPPSTPAKLPEPGVIFFGKIHLAIAANMAYVLSIDNASGKGARQMTHLNALQLRLSNERNYLAQAKTEGERELRTVWIAQIEREIAREQGGQFSDQAEMTDDELLAALEG